MSGPADGGQVTRRADDEVGLLDGALGVLAEGLGDADDGDALGHGGSGRTGPFTAAGGLAPGPGPGHSAVWRRTHTGFPSTTALGL